MADAKQNPEVIYLSVTGDEVEKVVPHMEKLTGFTIPYPAWASVEVAISNGRVVGFAPLMLIPHADGMWVAEDYRGTGVAEHLADRVTQVAAGSNMQQMLCMTNNDFVKELCRKRGFKEKGTYTVFVRE